MNKFVLTILPEKFGVCRLNKEENIPTWAINGNEFFSVTKTRDELSIVCSLNKNPSEVKTEKTFKAFKLEGQIDFALTGVLSSLLAPLAEAKISIFAISTYDTDYILVKEQNLEKAKEILSKTCVVKQ